MKQSSALIIALTSGLSILLPQPAISGEIGFRITNNSSVSWCGGITGPWGRFGPFNNITPGVINAPVYGAIVNLFSPFGKWILIADVISAHGCDPGFVRTVELDFCLVNSNSILITFGPDGNPTVNAPSPPCDSVVQATAFLGHASGQRSERDRDVFRFEGDAGDEVVVTLEPEGTMGSTGEDARLILRNQSGGPLREDANGPLPLKLEAALPETGSYEVVVEGRPGSSNPFRGHYQLTLRSTSEAEVALEPLTSVEP